MTQHRYNAKLEAVTLAAREAAQAYQRLTFRGDGNGHELVEAMARLERRLVAAGYPVVTEKVEAAR
jgi:hypothetical protein